MISPDHQTPIVLLHSLGTDSGLWRHQIESFEAIAPVVTLDSRGHGKNPWSGSATMADWVSDLHQAIAAIGPVHLVGLSMGGMQAVAYAATHPDMVASLIVANCFAALPSSSAEERVTSAERAVNDRGIAAYANTYLAETLTTTISADDYAVLRNSIANMQPEAYLESARATFYGDISKHLQKVRCPTLTITGAQDRKTPREALERIAADIPNTRTIVLERAGHLSCIENPEGFNREVISFFRQLGFLNATRATREALR